MLSWLSTVVFNQVLKVVRQLLSVFYFGEWWEIVFCLCQKTPDIFKTYTILGCDYFYEVKNKEAFKQTNTTPLKKLSRK